MPVRFPIAVALLGVICLQTGCMSTNPVSRFFRKSADSFKSTLANEPEPALRDDGEWDFVGQEARGNRPVEHDPDAWWQTYIMSEKARSIERNLGIE